MEYSIILLPVHDQRLKQNVLLEEQFVLVKIKVSEGKNIVVLCIGFFFTFVREHTLCMKPEI